jgi:glycosyltransferase involved in cell wall biosynthesis
MPVYLGEYEGCADGRREKFFRAVESFLNNRFEHSELIVVADGCEETKQIFADYELYFNRFRKKNILVKYLGIEKQPLFSGSVRQAGLDLASGEIICYLDSDDQLADFHLQNLYAQMVAYDCDWAYFDDFVNLGDGDAIRIAEVEHGKIGTSCLCHKREIGVTWTGCDGYGHDFEFVKRLQSASSKYDKIYGTKYIVNHIPNLLDK